MVRKLTVWLKELYGVKGESGEEEYMLKGIKKIKSVDYGEKQTDMAKGVKMNVAERETIAAERKDDRSRKDRR